MKWEDFNLTLSKKYEYPMFLGTAIDVVNAMKQVREEFKEVSKMFGQQATNKKEIMELFYLTELGYQSFVRRRLIFLNNVMLPPNTIRQLPFQKTTTNILLFKVNNSFTYREVGFKESVLGIAMVAFCEDKGARLKVPTWDDIPNWEKLIWVDGKNEVGVEKTDRAALIVAPFGTTMGGLKVFFNNRESPSRMTFTEPILHPHVSEHDGHFCVYRDRVKAYFTHIIRGDWLSFFSEFNGMISTITESDVYRHVPLPDDDENNPHCIECGENLANDVFEETFARCENCGEPIHYRCVPHREITEDDVLPSRYSPKRSSTQQSEKILCSDCLASAIKQEFTFEGGKIETVNRFILHPDPRKPLLKDTCSDCGVKFDPLHGGPSAIIIPEFNREVIWSEEKQQFEPTQNFVFDREQTFSPKCLACTIKKYGLPHLFLLLVLSSGSYSYNSNFDVFKVSWDLDVEIDGVRRTIKARDSFARQLHHVISSLFMEDLLIGDKDYQRIMKLMEEKNVKIFFTPEQKQAVLNNSYMRFYHNSIHVTFSESFVYNVVKTPIIPIKLDYLLY